jgi:hypothetical protein
MTIIMTMRTAGTLIMGQRVRMTTTSTTTTTAHATITGTTATTVTSAAKQPLGWAPSAL